MVASNAPTGALPAPVPSTVRSLVIVHPWRFWSVLDATYRAFTSSAHAWSFKLA